MLTLLNRYFWVFSFIWSSCLILGTLSVETVTPKQLPADVFKSLRQANGSEILSILNNTRRIIFGREVDNNRPYMVYLKLPSSNVKYTSYRRWLCGGVIVHEEYILTSAACIEDVRNFYVVAGTFKYSYADDRLNNQCIRNGSKKAIWKCIPKNYIFDGHENDNIRWMNNDIAVVKLEDEFDFSRRVRGCDYAPKPICYNNQSAHYEQAEHTATVVGWGSHDSYSEWVNARKGGRREMDVDRINLQEAPVMLMEKAVCKRLWGRRYHNIIENYMICSKDMTAELSIICSEKYVDCTDIMSESDETSPHRRWNPDEMSVHSAKHNFTATRRDPTAHDGGFCENDHGGPLIYGEGADSLVIGIISACLVKERTNKCYGPFLYTSVWKNRVLINCAIYKDLGQSCSKMFRAGGTHTEVEMTWKDHPDGPAKSEVKAMRRKEEEERLQEEAAQKLNTTGNLNATISQQADNSSISIAGAIINVEDENNKTVANKSVT